MVWHAGDGGGPFNIGNLQRNHLNCELLGAITGLQCYYWFIVLLLVYSAITGTDLQDGIGNYTTATFHT